ncbi:MAG: preprotein translocase subunit SecG [Rhizobiales bacterium]|nr:preprotein translocase subunit SecG [Hyphomicrobiales bacterium]
METVLIVVHLIIVIAMAGVILLQRSEGGALGMGGGGFMTGRGSGNLLTRTTAILAAAFFATSIGLSIVSNYGSGTSVLDNLPGASRDGGLQPLVPTPATPEGAAPGNSPTSGPQVPKPNP